MALCGRCICKAWNKGRDTLEERERRAVWEEGVRVGWEVNVRDRGGSGIRIAYIADLYEAEGASN